uniref:Uncharacterized protein n=1 Tax=Oryzias latipes TaxID=8090 RepID=A0A3P9MME9_ORYLA
MFLFMDNNTSPHFARIVTDGHQEVGVPHMQRLGDRTLPPTDLAELHVASEKCHEANIVCQMFLASCKRKRMTCKSNNRALCQSTRLYCLT